jgi:hypothetical protein
LIPNTPHPYIPSEHFPKFWDIPEALEIRVRKDDTRDTGCEGLRAEMVPGSFNGGDIDLDMVHEEPAGDELDLLEVVFAVEEKESATVEENCGIFVGAEEGVEAEVECGFDCGFQFCAGEGG